MEWRCGVRRDARDCGRGDTAQLELARRNAERDYERNCEAVFDETNAVASLLKASVVVPLVEPEHDIRGAVQREPAEADHRRRPASGRMGGGRGGAG